MSTNSLTKVSEKEIKNAKTRKAFSRIKTSVIAAISTMMFSMMFAMASFATTPSGNVETQTKDAWNTVMDLITEWIPRIGVVVIFIGAVEFAFAFKSEDAEGKTKALRTIAAGAIVGGVCLALGAMLKIS